MEIRATTASEALPLLARAVMDGDEVGSRNGRVMELLYPHVILTEPWRREILTPGRQASLPAQIAETMWVLAGRNDVEWLGRYLPRAKDFSDDGVVWRGGYGPRLRGNPGIDQLAHVVDLLRADPLSRRAVISIYNPAVDTEPGKDIPCNNWLHFQSRLGYLHMHVTIRSNDLIWGWSGINAFEWSALQEIIAGMLGIMVGELHFSISSLHVYDRHWGKAEKIANADVFFSGADSPRFRMPSRRNLMGFDNLVRRWFDLEDQIRIGKWNHTEVLSFPEPMFRSWLQVLEWWWSGDDSFLMPLRGTALEAAAQLSPMSARARGHQVPQCDLSMGYTRVGYPKSQGLMQVIPPLHVPRKDPFREFVSRLHSEKDKVYGDSWKRRGEQIGILANIARKVDRLGVDGAGDTSADTAVDLLVYLAKYRLWLADGGAPAPAGFGEWDRPLGDGPLSVDHLIMGLSSDVKTTTDDLIEYEKKSFEALSLEVERDDRYQIVDEMLDSAYPLAQRLWTAEQPKSEGQRIDEWKAGNAKRVWQGYDS